MAKPQKSMSVYSSFSGAKARERVDQSSLFNSSWSQYGREKVAGLVGENCLVKCMANKNPTVMLLDTGARVSIVRKSY